MVGGRVQLLTTRQLSTHDRASPLAGWWGALLSGQQQQQQQEDSSTEEPSAAEAAGEAAAATSGSKHALLEQLRAFGSGGLGGIPGSLLPHEVG